MVYVTRRNQSPQTMNVILSQGDAGLLALITRKRGTRKTTMEAGVANQFINLAMTIPRLMSRRREKHQQKRKAEVKEVSACCNVYPFTQIAAQDCPIPYREE